MAVPLDDRMSRALQGALELSASISGVDQAARERLAAAFEADARAIEMVARILASDEVRLLHEREPALRECSWQRSIDARQPTNC
jgi:hypothetical protein